MPSGIYIRTNNKGWFKKGHKINQGKKYSKKRIEKNRQWHLKNPLRYWLGRERSKETLEKIAQKSIFQKGNKHRYWKGGISYEPYSEDWTKELKNLIRQQDNFVCQLCFKNGYSVHHIDYNKKNCQPKNLITLCKKCNSKVNYNREKWTKYFNEKKEKQTIISAKIKTYSR